MPSAIVWFMACRIARRADNLEIRIINTSKISVWPESSFGGIHNCGDWVGTGKRIIKSRGKNLNRLEGFAIHSDCPISVGWLGAEFVGEFLWTALHPKCYIALLVFTPDRGLASCILTASGLEEPGNVLLVRY